MSMVPSTPQRQQKRARGPAQAPDAADGAREIGQGNPVVNPPRNIPHAYNDKFTVNLTYCDAYNINTTYTVGASQIWKMNSIFKPDETGTGHQPFPRDLWASMYDSYAVLSCEYDIQIFNRGADTITYTAAGSASQRPDTVIVNLARSTTKTDITMGAVNPYRLAEKKYVQTKCLTSGFPHGIRFQGILTPGDFSMDSIDVDNDKAWTAVGADPGVPRYFGIVCNPLQSAAFAGQNEQPYILMQVFVTLKYTVQFGQVNATLRQAES